MAPPLFLHIPHASTEIPPSARPDFLLPEAELAEERLRLTDGFTDELFGEGWPPELTWRAPVSRLVVDVERFRDDAHEPCAVVGMGAVYVRGTRGQVLRAPSAARRELLLETYYDPHHRRCAADAAKALATTGGCLVLDAHSYPSVPLPTERSGSLRPEIGLGTDPLHTPPALRALAEGFFRARGFAVAVDQPYAGAFVPTGFFGEEPRVQALMVEVRRDLYMDEATGAKHAGFAAVQAALTDFRAALAAYAAA
jgi:N-formylglutamate deformylase